MQFEAFLVTIVLKKCANSVFKTSLEVINKQYSYINKDWRSKRLNKKEGVNQERERGRNRGNGNWMEYLGNLRWLKKTGRIS